MTRQRKKKEVEALLVELLERLSPEEVTGKGGLMQKLQKRRNRGNWRNGHSRKRVKSGTAEVEIEVPRDRGGKFEPVLVPKGQRRLPGFDEKVLSLFARGMTTREIQGL